MRRRWKVQASICRDWTNGEDEPLPYRPTHHWTRFGAARQRRRLERSFAPGMAWVRTTHLDETDDVR